MSGIWSSISQVKASVLLLICVSFIYINYCSSNTYRWCDLEYVLKFWGWDPEPLNVWGAKLNHLYHMASNGIWLESLNNNKLIQFKVTHMFETGSDMGPFNTDAALPFLLPLVFPSPIRRLNCCIFQTLNIKLRIVCALKFYSRLILYISIWFSPPLISINEVIFSTWTVYWGAESLESLWALWNKAGMS